MKWTVKLIAETAPGVVTEHDLLALERPDQLALAQLGLSVEEAKQLLAALQNQLVLSPGRAPRPVLPKLPALWATFPRPRLLPSHFSFAVRQRARAGAPLEDVPLSGLPAPELLDRLHEQAPGRS